jgi:hypothetical protein
MLFTFEGETLDSEPLKLCPACRHCQRGFFSPQRWYCMMGEQAREVKEGESCEKWETREKILERK